MRDYRDVSAALISGCDLFDLFVCVHGVFKKRLVEIKVMEAERFEHVDLLLGRMPYACAAQLERIRKLRHNPFKVRMLKCSDVFGKQIHKPERTLLGHIKGDKLPVGLKSLLADIKGVGKVFDIAGAAVEIYHVVGVFF